MLKEAQYMTSISTPGAIAALVPGHRINLSSVASLRHVWRARRRFDWRAIFCKTVSLMVSGAQGIVNAVLRNSAAGVLAGVLIGVRGGEYDC